MLPRGIARNFKFDFAVQRKACGMKRIVLVASASVGVLAGLVATLVVTLGFVWLREGGPLALLFALAAEALLVTGTVGAFLCTRRRVGGLLMVLGGGGGAAAVHASNFIGCPDCRYYGEIFLFIPFALLAAAGVMAFAVWPTVAQKGRDS